MRDRTRPPPAGGRRRSRRPGRARLGRARLALVVVAVAALVGAVVVIASAQGGRPAAVSLPSADHVPMAYHIVYRVTSGPAVSTEDLWVVRPFEAEDTNYAGLSPTGTPISTVVTRLGRQLLHDAGGEPTVFEPPPGPTPFDVRLDALGQAPANSIVGAGALRIAGRDCRVYRTAQPLATATLTAAPTPADHVDSCLDGEGLLLDERHTSGGKLTIERRAVSVSVGREAEGHTFATVGTHVPVNRSGGKVVTVTDTSRPPGQSFWELAQPPTGFTHLGRFAVVPPQPPAIPGQAAAPLVTAIADVFVRGADVIVVEQGQTVGGAAYQLTGGRDIDLGALGRGQLLLSPLASSVTAPGSVHGGFVRVTGTTPPDLLGVVARSLVQQPAGTIVTIPDLTSDGA